MSTKKSTFDLVLARSAERDRVMDAVKTLALVLVMVGHSVAWTTTTAGSITNTLEAAPWLFPMTWILQILPLFFFLAGQGLHGLAARPSAQRYFSREYRLLGPATLLVTVALVLSSVLAHIANPTIGDAAGILPIQLTWFLGVYVAIVALTPALVRISSSYALVAFWILAICVVDVARIHASESFGWLNLLLVWALFAILGLKLSQLRALPTPVKASVALLSLIAALILIHIGPYSAALISTPAVPGISNLAPPTVVLACVGVAQIFILLLIWPLLSRIMNRDRIWVPVAVFSARAMQLYLFHMLFLALGIGVMFLWGGTPTPLGVVWWAEHVAVFVVAIGSVWMLAPWLASAAAALNNFLGKVWPRCIVQRTATSPLWAVRTYVFVSALLVIIMSDSGVGRPFTTQPVVGIPQIPVVTVLLLFALVSLAGRVDAMSRLDPAVPD